MGYISSRVRRGEDTLTTRNTTDAVKNHSFGITGDKVEEMEHYFKNVQHIELFKQQDAAIEDM